MIKRRDGTYSGGVVCILPIFRWNYDSLVELSMNHMLCVDPLHMFMFDHIWCLCGLKCSWHVLCILVWWFYACGGATKISMMMTFCMWCFFGVVWWWMMFIVVDVMFLLSLHHFPHCFYQFLLILKRFMLQMMIIVATIKSWYIWQLDVIFCFFMMLLIYANWWATMYYCMKMITIVDI